MSAAEKADREARLKARMLEASRLDLRQLYDLYWPAGWVEKKSEWIRRPVLKHLKSLRDRLPGLIAEKPPHEVKLITDREVTDMMESLARVRAPRLPSEYPDDLPSESDAIYGATGASGKDEKLRLDIIELRYKEARQIALNAIRSGEYVSGESWFALQDETASIAIAHIGNLCVRAVTDAGDSDIDTCRKVTSDLIDTIVAKIKLPQIRGDSRRTSRDSRGKWTSSLPSTVIDKSCIKNLISRFKPQAEIPIDDWVIENVELDGGPFSLETRPYAREILRAIADPAIRRVVILASAQCGKSSIIVAAIAWVARHAPGNILLALNTEEMAGKLSRDKLRPPLQKLDIWRDKEYKIATLPDGSMLRVVGANQTGLRSSTVPHVFCDESSAFPPGAIQQAAARSRVCSLPTVVIASTPDEKTHDFASEWRASTQEQWCIPCADCGEYSPLDFDNLTWDRTSDDDGETDIDKAAESVHWKCPKCDSGKRDIRNPLVWREVSQAAKFAVNNENSDKSVRGFRFSVPCLPPQFADVSGMIRKFYVAKREAKAGAPAKLREWQTLENAKFWSPEIMWQARTVDINDSFAITPEPRDNRFIGVDVKKSCLHVVVLEVDQAAAELRVVHATQVPGYTELYDLQKRWTPDPLGERGRKRYNVAIDSGWDTQEVQRQAAQNYWIAIKGESRGLALYTHASGARLKNPKQWYSNFDSVSSGRNRCYTCRLNVDIGKDLIAAMLDKTSPWNLRVSEDSFASPADADEWMAAMQSERKEVITDSRGFRRHQWVCLKPKENHYWDALVYALAMGTIRRSVTLDPEPPKRLDKPGKI